MKIKYKRNHRGFTLVELSIVLVIIGLLIGGILVAQSMTITSKIQATIGQISQFDVAVENFETAYTSLPGDNNLFGTAGIANAYSNDGGITDGASSYDDDALFQLEIGAFWYDLKQVGFREDDGKRYINCAAFCSGPATVVPKSKLGNNVSWIAASLVAAKKSNYYIASNLSNPNIGTVGLKSSANPGAYRSSEMLAIDTKMDDGTNLNTGNVFTYSGCGLGGAYDTTSNTLCVFAVRIGTRTGNLK